MMEQKEERTMIRSNNDYNRTAHPHVLEVLQEVLQEQRLVLR